MIDNKKGMNTMEVVIGAILLLALLFILLYSFTDMFGGQRKAIESQMNSITEDEDNDGTVNFYDKCPCDRDIERDATNRCDGKEPDWCFNG